MEAKRTVAEISSIINRMDSIVQTDIGHFNSLIIYNILLGLNYNIRRHPDKAQMVSANEPGVSKGERVILLTFWLEQSHRGHVG